MFFQEARVTLPVVEIFFIEDARTILIIDVKGNCDEVKKVFDDYKGTVTLFFGDKAVGTFPVYTERFFRSPLSDDRRALGTMHALTLPKEQIRSRIETNQCYLRIDFNGWQESLFGEKSNDE